jgi:outer membrane murein-binding lipoprotein Lpp
MAKEEIHNWMRTAILLMGIVFAGGGYAMKISDNSNKAEKNAAKIDSVEEDVHAIEIKQERDLALKVAINNTMVRMETKMDNISNEQTQIKLDVNSTKVKIDTLTKD